MQQGESYTAFAGSTRIASGRRGEVTEAARTLLASGDLRPILLFDDATGTQLEVDLRSPAAERADAAPDIPEPPPRTPGRPKLGVIGREVTLLPRHWEWLNAQPGGASVALRKLVEMGRRNNETVDRVRRAQEATFRFMSAIAGNEVGFEEANRSLFAGDSDRFDSYIRTWPPDVPPLPSEAQSRSILPGGDPWWRSAQQVHKET